MLFAAVVVAAVWLASIVPRTVVHLDVGTLSFIAGSVIPLLVGLLTKYNAHPGLKGTLNALLSGAELNSRYRAGSALRSTNTGQHGTTSASGSGDIAGEEGSVYEEAQLRRGRGLVPRCDRVPRDPGARCPSVGRCERAGGRRHRAHRGAAVRRPPARV
jgi:hypothetical protein